MISLKCAAVICAAGGGSRMGQNKALCHFADNISFLESIVSTIRLVTPNMPIIAVVGAQADEVMRRHRHIDMIWAENPLWQSTHMLDSLLLGMHSAPDTHDILHWPVDCIGIDPADLKKLIDAPCPEFSQLSFHHIPGHPVRISAQKARFIRENAARFGSLRDIMQNAHCVQIEASSDALMNCNDHEQLKCFQLAHGLISTG